MEEQNNINNNIRTYENSERDMNINTSIVHIFKVSGEELNLANKIEINIVKLGIEGITFKTFFYLHTKMSFCFELPLSKVDKLFLVAEIIDVKDEDDDDYVYMCKFLHLASIEQNKIKEFIEDNKNK